MLGLLHRYGESVDAAVTRLGWPRVDAPDRWVSEPVEAPDSLRRRLAADNEADLEFFAFACELYEQRKRTTA